MPTPLLILICSLAAPPADLPVPPEMALEPLPLRAPAPADNPTTPEKAALGRLLFFDPILSGTRQMACATCHQPTRGWADSRPTAVSSVGLVTRNTPTILNVAFNGLVAGQPYDASGAPMFWDSRVAGLEAQAVEPMRTREEMRGDSITDAHAVEQAVERIAQIAEYRSLFQHAFGDDRITAAPLTQALAAFERTLITPDSRYDRYLRGDKSAISAAEQRGLDVFKSAGCTMCHGGPMLSDFKLHFIASPGSVGDRRPFRTPSLRNLRHTAPYMHNGSLRTVDDVLVFYEQLSDAVSETLDGADTAADPPLDPLLRKLNLRADDFDTLKAFLDTLSVDTYDQTAPARVPSGLPVPK